MDFIIGPNKINEKWKSIKFGDYFLNYYENNEIQERELVIDNEDFSIIGDINISFGKLIRNNYQPSNILKNIEKLTNGYLLIYDKNKSSLALYTDIVGYYHIFYLSRDNKIVISSDFKFLLELSSGEIDNFALLDLVLFKQHVWIA